MYSGTSNAQAELTTEQHQPDVVEIMFKTEVKVLTSVVIPLHINFILRGGEQCFTIMFPKLRSDFYVPLKPAQIDQHSDSHSNCYHFYLNMLVTFPSLS